MKSTGLPLLHTVTVTGADDAVDPIALLQLADRFPFVEWGLLWSEKRRGSARYPSAAWLAGWAPRFRRASLHLCGAPARATFEGQAGPSTIAVLAGARRVQLNGWENVEQRPVLSHLGKVFADLPSVEFILQSSCTTSLRYAADYARMYRVSALVDASGGTGRHMGDPVLCPPPRLSIGYAGGITPDNVVETLDNIAVAGRSFWIDLETGARDESDRFDLERVEAVLARADEWRRLAS